MSKQTAKELATLYLPKLWRWLRQTERVEKLEAENAHLKERVAWWAAVANNLRCRREKRKDA